jgi:hypothetical protein
MTDAIGVHARLPSGGCYRDFSPASGFEPVRLHRSNANFNGFQVSNTKLKPAVWIQLIIPRGQTQARFAEARRHWFLEHLEWPKCAIITSWHSKLSASKMHSNRRRAAKVWGRGYGNQYP